ncbi:aromatic hydrocarbon degradation protein [Thioclava sp. BHET1]|nr:aromatic hydrocarbon degradation protein [Thioclava sp. BHET1]
MSRKIGHSRERDMTHRMVATLAAATGLVLAGGTAASARGIDRSGQSISPLFAPGSYVELTFGFVNPKLSGKNASGQSTGDVAKSYVQGSAAFKQDINDRWSYAVILDQAFGADITYGPGDPELYSTATGQGTHADAITTDLTTLLRYKFTENFSLYGGVRLERANGEIRLNGTAYTPTGFPYGFSGHKVKLDDDYAAGYVLGAAYEIPKYAARISLTYNSSIRHDFDTTESGPLVSVLTGQSSYRSKTTVKLPQSINLDFQTGINPTTLLFGSVRWANWSQFTVNPVIYSSATTTPLVDVQNSTTYTLGLGHRFSDAWSGLAQVMFEPQRNTMVSPLAPSTGLFGVTLAAIYTHGNMKITTGINYTHLGNASIQPGYSSRANFKGNSSVGIGVKVGWTL